jgi:type IV pilus assembly protein PilP
MPKVIFTFFLTLAVFNAGATFATGERLGKSAVVEVSVHNADALGVLRILSYATKANLIVGPGVADRRISLRKEFADTEATFNHIASELGAELVKTGSIYVIKPACLANPKPTKFPLTGVGAISLGFRQISAHSIFEVLRFHAFDTTLRTPSVPENERFAMMISVKDSALANIIDAIGIASGRTIQEFSATKTKVVRMKSLPCAESVDPPEKSGNAPLNKSAVAHEMLPGTLKQVEPETVVDPDTRKKVTLRRLQPLESYALKEMIVRGSVSVNGNIWGYLETTDGIAWPIRERDYLGLAFGLVTAVNREGITIKEVLQNKEGLWGNRTIRMGFDDSRRIGPLLVE